MMIVLFGALLLGVFQLLPLPLSTLGAIAPQNAKLWQDLATTKSAPGDTQVGLDTGEWSERDSFPVSLFPSSGKTDLALLSVGVCVFVIAAIQFSSERSVRILLLSLAFCGAALGFFGIVQRLTWNGKIYGVVALSQGGSPFAAFINRNNAGGYLNLCLAACLGLFVLSLGSLRRRDGHPTTDSRFDFRSLLANVSGLQVFAALTSVVVLGAVFASLSRGAMFACLFSFAILAFASRRFVRNPWWNMAAWSVLVLGGVALTAWVGLIGNVQQRAESVTRVLSQPDGRWNHWRDSLLAASQFWPVGTGLGTHRYIYRLFESFPANSWYFHAENQYVEALVEGGWLGLSLLVAAVLLTFVACWQLLRHAADTLDYVVGLVGLFAISSQAIHACFDFGLYLPSNMVLLAVLCGVVHGRNVRRQRLARSSGRGPQTARHSTSERRSTLRLGLAGVTCAMLVCAIVQLTGNAKAAAAVRSVPATPLPPAQIGSDLTAIRAWEIASLANPEDAEIRLRAARAWIDRYRHLYWESLTEQRPNVDPNVLWQLTAPAEIHTTVRALEQSNRAVDLEEFRSSRMVRDNLVPAVRHLAAARAACPLIPEVHLLLCELEPAVSSRVGAGEGIQRVAICAPRRGGLLAEAGFVAMVDSQPEAAASFWRQATTAEPQRFPALLRIAASQAVMRNHLTEMLPNDLTLLIDTARKSFSAPADHDLQTLITKHAKGILPTAKIDVAQRCHWEGVLLLLENQPESAIDRLTQATQMNPLEVAWRYDLATALADQGMTEQARNHASFCTRMEPENELYAALLKRLIRTSLTTP